MKLRYIIFIILTFYKNVYTQQTLIDIYSRNKISYNIDIVKMEKNECIDYNNLYIGIPRFENFIDTLIQNKLNRLIEFKMKGQLNNIDFRKKLSLHSIKAEMSYYQNSKSKNNATPTCDFNQALYAPNISKVEYYFGALNHDIVPFVVTFTYSAVVKNNIRLVSLRYTDLIYINIKSGNTFKPDEVFKTTSFTIINDLIIKKYKQKDFYIKNKEFVNKNQDNQNDDYYFNDEEEQIYVEENYSESSYDESYNEVIGESNVAIEEEIPDPPLYDTDEMSFFEKEPAMEAKIDEAPPILDYEINKKTSEGSGYYNGSNYGSYGSKRGYGDGYYEENSNSKFKTINPDNERFQYMNGIYDLNVELKDFNFEKYGLILLNAISFTYVIPAFQTCHSLPFGKAAKMILTLQDLKAFINPAGPYSFLLNEVSSSFEGQYKQIIDTENEKINNLIHGQIQNLKLGQTSKIKSVEISIKNPNFLKSNWRKKDIIDSNQYIVKYYRTYQNSNLVYEKIMELNYPFDSSFSEVFYTYNNSGKLILKTQKKFKNHIEIDTFIYDIYNNLVLHKQFINSILKSNQFYFYKNQIVYEENFKDFNDEPEIVRYNFNKNRKIDSITNNFDFENKILTYDSAGNLVLVYIPTDCYNSQYYIYNIHNELITKGTLDNENIFEIEYDINSKEITQIKKNSELLVNKEFDNINRIIKITFSNSNSILFKYFD